MLGLHVACICHHILMSAIRTMFRDHLKEAFVKDINAVCRQIARFSSAGFVTLDLMAPCGLTSLQ